MIYLSSNEGEIVKGYGLSCKEKDRAGLARYNSYVACHVTFGRHVASLG